MEICFLHNHTLTLIFLLFASPTSPGRFLVGRSEEAEDGNADAYSDDADVEAESDAEARALK